MKGNISIHITLKVSHIPSNSKKYINSILKRKKELQGSGSVEVALPSLASNVETTEDSTICLQRCELFLAS